jgi:hypothetical protein
VLARLVLVWVERFGRWVGGRRWCLVVAIERVSFSSNRDVNKGCVPLALVLSRPFLCLLVLSRRWRVVLTPGLQLVARGWGMARPL